MLTLLVGGLLGVGIGLARRGSLSSLAELRFRACALPCLAVLVQVGSGLLPADRRFLAIGGTYAIVAIWLLINARTHCGSLRAALGLLGAGWLLNTLPILLNRGMPVSLHALQRIGAPGGTAVDDGHLFKHVAAGTDTKVAALGDVIPLPPLATVISVGDIVVVVAIAWLLASAMAVGQRRLEAGEDALAPDMHQQ